MSREGKWRSELIETLPDGTRSYRIAKSPRPPKQHHRVMADYIRRFMSLYDEGLSDTKIGEALGFHRMTVGSFRRGLGLPAHFAFGHPPLSDMEKLRIRELHAEGLPINRIAGEISRSYPLVMDFCREEKLDTSRSRGKGYARMHRGERVIAYLEERGPTPQSTLSTELGIYTQHFPRLSRELFDRVERLWFKVGGGTSGRGGTKHGGTKVYGDLGDMGVVFAIRGDPRVVDFVAKRIPFKVETPVDARTLVLHLKRQIGYDRAREVVERLGYRYQTASHKVKRRPRPTGATPSPLKFTDDELLRLYAKELNDVEIAAVLGVSSVAVNYRRRKLGLPPQGRGRFRALNFLTQIEIEEAEDK